jgi:hypothetical protein
MEVLTAQAFIINLVLLRCSTPNKQLEVFERDSFRIPVEESSRVPASKFRNSHSCIQCRSHAFMVYPNPGNFVLVHPSVFTLLLVFRYRCRCRSSQAADLVLAAKLVFRTRLVAAVRPC